MKSQKKLFLIIVLLALVLIPWRFKEKNNQQTIIENSFTEQTNIKIVKVNFLGTDEHQQVVVKYENGYANIAVEIGNKVISADSFPEEFLRPPEELSAITLSENSKKQYLFWKQVAGPHHFEIYVFTVYNNKLVNLLAANFETEKWYMPFWLSRGPELLIKDINQDGLKEIVEFVDEFPAQSPRLNDQEIKKITIDQFGEQDGEKVWKIVSRENSGKGRGLRVAWNIYSFIDAEKPYFKKLNDNDYEQMVKILLKDSPAYLGKSTFSMEIEDGLFTPDPNIDLSDTISRSQLSKDSIEFNNYVRDFWAGNYYEEEFGKHRPEIIK